MLDRLLRAGPGLALVAALAAVTVHDPHVPGAWAVCPTWTLLGVACPGCGSLRALHDIGQGRWVESIGHNLLVLPGIAFIAWAGLGTPGSRWSRIWLGAVVMFTVVRNIPGSPLAP